MKKLFFALLFVLTAVTAVNAQTKIGHVNSQKVLDTIPSRVKAIDEINMVQEMGIKELTAMDSTIQSMVAFYQAHPEWGELTKRNYEGQIREQQMRFESRQNAIDKDLQDATAALNKRTLDLVKKAVSNVSAAKKLNYVIDESVLLYNSGGIDITAEVITEVLKLDAATK